MTFDPKVTVGIVLGEGKDEILETLASVCTQSHRHLEIVVLSVDPSSESTRIAKLVAKMDPRVVVLDSGKTLGSGEAKNRLISRSHGYLFCLVSPGDQLESTALSAMVSAFLANPKLGMCYANHREIDVSGNLLRIDEAPDFSLEESGRIGWNRFYMVRLDFVFALGGFSEKLPGCENADLMARLAETYPCTRIPFPLYVYRVGHSRSDRKKVSCKVCPHLAVCKFYKMWSSYSKSWHLRHRGSEKDVLRVKVNASPCSGKTTFVRANRYLYRGVALFDSDETNEASGLVDVRFLDYVDSDSCFLGPIDKAVGQYPVTQVAVVIPDSELDRNMAKRAEKFPEHYWSSRENILSARRKLQRYCEENGTQIFESFQLALDWCIDRRPEL